MIKSEVSLKISAMRFKANILESFIFWSHSNFSISSLISNVPNLSSPIRNNSHRECHETWNFEKEKKKKKKSVEQRITNSTRDQETKISNCRNIRLQPHPLPSSLSRRNDAESREGSARG